MNRSTKCACASVSALAFLMLAASTTFTHASDPATATSHAQQAQDNLPAFTKAREAAALVFVKQHQPELLELLKLVHEKNTAEYQKAICKFFAWSEKVADAKGEDNGAVAVALHGWAIEIQTQILGGQILRHPDQADELKQQMKKLFEHSVELQMAHVTQQIAQAEHQLESLRKQQESLASNREQIIHERLKAVDQLVAKHREQGGLQAEFEQSVRQIQEAAAKRQQQGGDVSAVAELMQQVGPLVRDGKVDAARALLKKAAELLKE